jgi:hypothetical protein
MGKGDDWGDISFFGFTIKSWDLEQTMVWVFLQHIKKTMCPIRTPHPRWWTPQGNLKNLPHWTNSDLQQRTENYGKIQMNCSEFHQWLLHVNNHHFDEYWPYSLVPDLQNFLNFHKLWDDPSVGGSCCMWGKIFSTSFGVGHMITWSLIKDFRPLSVVLTSSVV